MKGACRTPAHRSPQALELLDLQDLDFKLGLTGFGDEELARLLAAQDAAEGLTGEDAVPELPETIVLSRNLARRLERLEAELAPPSDEPIMVIHVTSPRPARPDYRGARN